MTKISDLSGDLLSEILSRVPLTSLCSVRSTSKEWNDSSKNQILGEKAAKSRSQFLEFMMIKSTVSSLRFDLQGIHNTLEDDDNLLDHVSMKQISIPNNHQIEISQVSHCDGLLLCVTKCQERLFVWNPYLGQTKWIQPRNKFLKFDTFALGHDNNRNHKILRLVWDPTKTLIDVYDFTTDSWRLLDDVDPSWDLPSFCKGVSLKGNTYFFGQEVTTTGEKPVAPNMRVEVTDIEDYLICFDYTTERFGPRLSLPFQPPYPCFDVVIRSWVRDEKLAVLYSHCETPEIIEIWISTKTEPDSVSWISFLTVDFRLINGLADGFALHFVPTSFFIDEEKKVAVLFDFEYDQTETCSYHYQMARVFGEDGYFKSVNIGTCFKWEAGNLVCSSYVPRLVQLQV